MFLNQTEEKLQDLGVLHTYTEIMQQPKLWNEVFKGIIQQKEDIVDFFKLIFQTHERVKVILTGAGTSAFVGDTIAPFLKKICDSQTFMFESIPTTNIVSNPINYLDPKIPTIMVSFARSGNSPESVAAVELGEKIINDFYQIHITCNREGHLAKKAQKHPENTLLLLMPEECNDQGFAMTSSYTCMMLGALLIFQLDKIDTLKDTVSRISNIGTQILNESGKKLEEISNLPITNIVYLGSGPLLGLAHEASLKMLELTDGGVFTYYESPLGLRHGPKTIINDQTLVIIFLHHDEYTQKYDIDIIKELFKEKKRTQLKIMVISDLFIEEVKDNSDYYFYNHEDGLESVDDIWLAFPFILYAQMLAVYKSLNMGIKPDNPVPNGSVNRVVKGVTIYPYIYK